MEVRNVLRSVQDQQCQMNTGVQAYIFDVLTNASMILI